MGAGDRFVLLVGLVLLASCAKSEEAPRPVAKSRGGAGEGVVNAGLASAQGGAAESAKASLVAQQCALACGLHPENDTGRCIQRCTKECATTADLAGIDACAQRIASP